MEIYSSYTLLRNLATLPKKLFAYYGFSLTSDYGLTVSFFISFNILVQLESLKQTKNFLVIIPTFILLSKLRVCTIVYSQVKFIVPVAFATNA